MNIQFSNWQLINLQDFDNTVDSVSAGVADTDATLSQLAYQFMYFYDGNSSRAYGNWGYYDLYATGSGFTGSNPVARYIQLSDVFAQEVYRINGAVNVINSGIYYVNGGSFSSISHSLSGVVDYSVAGSFVYTPMGTIGGGTITSASINNASGKLTIRGNLTINTNEVITSGNVSEFSYTSLSGEKFSISNASFNFIEFKNAINSAGSSTDFSVIYNYFLNSGSLNGNDTITSGELDDNLNGYAGNDTLSSGAGNDTLDGGTGIDRLVGGLGDDQYIVDLIETGTTAALKRVALQDTIIEGVNAGTDTLELRGNFDHLNATTLALGANLEHLDASATGTTKLNLTGNTLANTITGNAADNILDGGVGVDSLIGGLGNDTYVMDLKVSGTGVAAHVNTFDDTITENNGTAEGIDTIKLRGSASLTNASTLALTGSWANIENLDASATGVTKLNLTGNDEDNILTGNAAANTLNGGLGNDTLNGGAGADTLVGGDGDDTYIVDNLLDTVIETNSDVVTGGIDLVKASVHHTLAANVENLELTGVAAINGTGNALDNVITGNAAANILDGKEGADTLIGGAGNDTLNGGADNDTLIGGSGNDVLTGGLGADTFVWNLADKGTNGRPAIDKITDFNSTEDVLDLRDLLVDESSGNILNYLDITTSTTSGVTNTEIRISNSGGFTNGNYSAAAENQHITLSGVNLLAGTNETDLLANLISQNKLIID